METNRTIPKKEYSCRDEEIRGTHSLVECVRRIQNIYHSGYDPDSTPFDAWDQLLACEALAESTPLLPVCDEINRDDIGNGKSGSVNDSGEMGNGGRKHTVNFELTHSKQKAVAELKQCDYKTDPIKIARFLEELFKEWPSNPGHWLYIAQHYPPRRINLTIYSMIKRHTSGRITFQDPAAYFTFSIKFRKKRKYL